MANDWIVAVVICHRIWIESKDHQWNGSQACLEAETNDHLTLYVRNYFDKT